MSTTPFQLTFYEAVGGHDTFVALVKRFVEARKILKPLAERAPGSASVRELYGLTLYRLERWRSAATELEAYRNLTGASDRLPVYGFDPAASGFFWCAGQGGFGIQTAPAGAALAAALLLGAAPDPMVAAIDPTAYAPGRFRMA